MRISLSLARITRKHIPDKVCVKVLKMTSKCLCYYKSYTRSLITTERWA
jgi:hypothetical protein